MYIRRKAFSVVRDEETGEEKLFSTTEIMSEEAYLERLYSEKSKKDEKKAKIAGGVAAGLGIGSMIAGNKSLDAALKSKEIADSYNMNNLLHKYDKKIAAKTGTTASPFVGIIGDPDKVKKAEELSKRHRKIVQRAVDNQAKKANELGAVGAALGAASLGAAAYGLKKKRDAKKDE